MSARSGAVAALALVVGLVLAYFILRAEPSEPGASQLSQPAVTQESAAEVIEVPVMPPGALEAREEVVVSPEPGLPSSPASADPAVLALEVAAEAELEGADSPYRSRQEVLEEMMKESVVSPSEARAFQMPPVNTMSPEQVRLFQQANAQKSETAEPVAPPVRETSEEERAATVSTMEEAIQRTRETQVSDDLRRKMHNWDEEGAPAEQSP